VQIQVIAVGKLTDRYLRDGVAEFEKRLGAYSKLELIEVPDESIPGNASKAQEDYLKAREGERLLSKVKAGSYMIALDIDGHEVSSTGFAEFMKDLGIRGQSNLAFVIGGTLGLSKEVLGAADFRLSLGQMTFPHQLVRMILLEQIYRAFRIIRGEPYHR